MSGQGYPSTLVPVGHVEPVPRRIRAILAGRVVLDTTRALYVWEAPSYPQYYVPLADVDPAVLVLEDRTQHLKRGTATPVGLRVGDTVRPAGRVYTQSPVEGLTGTVRLEWTALDAWFEEDEQVYVHPRSPYVRVVPTLALAPIAGLVAFYDEKVDTFLDGELLPRPVTHFS